MTYIIPGSARPLPARSADELVRHWHRASVSFRSVTLSAYLHRFAESFHELSGLVLRTDDANAFVADLVAYGWLAQNE